MDGKLLKSLSPALMGAALLLAGPAWAAPASQTSPLGFGTSAISGRALEVGLRVADTLVVKPQPGAPDVIVLSQATTAASPYLWSATKAADGSIAFAGHVPNADVRATLTDGVSKISADTTTVATGAPGDFSADAVAALDVLGNLDTGKASFDGSVWSVSGAVDSADKAKTAQAAFDASPLKSIGSQYDVAGPATAVVPLAPVPTPAASTASGAASAASTATPAATSTAAAPATASAPAAASATTATTVSSAPASAAAATTTAPAASAAAPAATAAAPATTAAPAAASTPTAPAAAPATATPVISPNYAWSAEKAADGTITFSGSVPNDKLKGFLDNRVGDKAVDQSSVADGAPKTFVGGALYGLGALMQLNSGKLAFAAGNWSLSGVAPDDATGKAAVAMLGVIDTKAWTFGITTAPTVAAAPAVAAPAASAASSATTAAAPAATTPAAPAAPATTAPAASAAPATTAAASAAPATAPTAAAPASATTTPAAAAPAVNPAYDFAAVKAADGAITMSGEVPTEGARGYFGDTVAGAKVDGLSVALGAPDNFITNALGGLTALSQLDNGQLAMANGKWSLKGEAPTPESRTAVLASLGTLPAGKDFAGADITGPAPLALCNNKLRAFTVAGGGVNFDGQGTKLVKGADASLDTVAAALALCPEARVYVEGNTDSDGGAVANMALSVARAEAVVDALVKRGIAVNRLYAVGYGQTLPLVPNTTKANKARNRRIAFRVEDVAQK